MPTTPLHDGLLVVAFGRSRYETNWKNKEISWSDLIKRFSKCSVTSETYLEYTNFPPELQDEKKDVGGFVGGQINGGRRKSGAVTSRYLLTLDVDFGGKDFFKEVRFIFPNGCAIYGTHKHHPPDAYRYRLIFPLRRPVLCDEYVALARKMAEIIDIEVFDPTTYQPERLMYWPSISKDSRFYSEWQDGPWIDPDAILGMYVNWQDVNEWPVSKREQEAIHKHGEKQGDPLEKPGVIGAFNRVYGITEVINAFLPEVYEATDDVSRWTYSLGSTSGGLVIYEDDTFAYSHHGTDPASGRLCNAFDLVRIHKYGKLDEKLQAGTPINKYPSHLAMEDFATQQPKVRIQLIEQHEKDLQDDFAEISGEITPLGIQEIPPISATGLSGSNGLDNGHESISGTTRKDNSNSSGNTANSKGSEGSDNSEWKGKLEVDRKGKILPTIPNFALILKYDPKLKNAIGWDDFAHLDTCLTDLPWRKIVSIGEPFGEVDMAALRTHVERVYKGISAPKLKDAFLRNRLRVKYHPIKQYLESVEWDGRKRVDTLLIDYLNAPENEYVKLVTRKALVACIARVYNPGVKFDNVLTFVGEEGLYKSTLLDILGGKWFSDSLGQIDNPKIFEQIQGVWLIEMGELSALRRAEIEMTKHFISKREDRFRVAYGTHVEKFPRQCIFFATTNNYDFLQDNNGNRRFWPVLIKEGAQFSIPAELPLERDQIWAEAMQYYNNGEALFLQKEMMQEAIKVQSEHTEYDYRVELIQEYLDKPNEETDPGITGEPKDRVSAIELWVYALGGMRKDLLPRNTKDIDRLMKKIKGWEKFIGGFRNGEFGVQHRGYKRFSSVNKI